MPNTHGLANHEGRFRISPYLQEMTVYLGQSRVFAEAGKSLMKMRGVEVDAKQVERLCHYYGQKLEEQSSRQIEKGEEFQYGQQGKQTHYAMVDGALVPLRKEGWKEVKLGRIMKACDVIQISKDRGYIGHSLYAAHLGGYREFEEKMDYYADPLKDLIIVADGAKWIWDWAATHHSRAVQILDFFHAMQHLCDFSKACFKDAPEGERWIKQQQQLLENNGCAQVIDHIRQLVCKNRQLKKQQKALLNYFQENQKRMQYKTYREKGWMIGSGPIESAHRQVIQQRMKLSGQHWTKAGAQQMANLRVAYCSNQWNKVTELINKAA